MGRIVGTRDGSTVLEHGGDEKQRNESQRNNSKRGEGTVLQKSPKSISIVSRTRAWKSPFPFIPALDGLSAGTALVWGEFFEGGACASGAGDPPGFGVVDLGNDKEQREKQDRQFSAAVSKGIGKDRREGRYIRTYLDANKRGTVRSRALGSRAVGVPSRRSRRFRSASWSSARRIASRFALRLRSFTFASSALASPVDSIGAGGSSASCASRTVTSALSLRRIASVRSCVSRARSSVAQLAACGLPLSPCNWLFARSMAVISL